jgi:hypothetical protein
MPKKNKPVKKSPRKQEESLDFTPKERRQASDLCDELMQCIVDKEHLQPYVLASAIVQMLSHYCVSEEHLDYIAQVTKDQMKTNSDMERSGTTYIQ